MEFYNTAVAELLHHKAQHEACETFRTHHPMVLMIDFTPDAHCFWIRQLMHSSEDVLRNTNSPGLRSCRISTPGHVNCRSLDD